MTWKLTSLFDAMKKTTHKLDAMKKTTHKPGDLQVWWVPQVPMKSFCVPVASVAMGVKVMEVLADYDLFQLEQRVKPDYCNAGGLQRWCADIDGDGTPGWEDWYDEDTGEDEPQTWLMLRAAKNGRKH